MNKRSKGMALERKAEQYLQSKGLLTWRPHSRAVFIGKGKWICQSQDIFGAFDIIAYGNHRIYLIQVTTMDSALPSHKKRKIESVDIDPSDVSIVVMAHEPRRWHFWVMQPDRSWKKIDEYKFVLSMSRR